MRSIEFRASCLRIGKGIFAGLVLVGIVAMAREISLSLPSTGVDFAHHYALTHELVEYGSRTVQKAYLGEMNWYPPGAHYLAAGLVRAVGMPEHAAIGWISYVSSFVLAGALVWLVCGGFKNRRSVLFYVIFIAGSYWLTSSGVSFFSQIQGSFFYSQHVAEAMGLVSLIIIFRQNLRLEIKTLLVGGAAAGIAYVHLLPALRMLAAIGVSASLMACRSRLSQERRGACLKEAAVGLGLLGVIGVAFIKFHPAYAAMKSIAENNGVLNFSWVAAGIAGFALPLGTMGWLQRKRSWGHVFKPDLELNLSLYLAAVALLMVQVVLFVGAHQGSEYAIRKHVFGVCTLGAALALSMLAGAVSRFQPRQSLVDRKGYLASIVAGALVVIATFRFGALENAERLSRAISWFKTDGAKFVSRSISFDREAHYLQSYLFNLAYLKASRNDPMNNAILTGKFAETIPALSQSSPWEGSAQYFILFSQGKPEVIERVVRP